MSNGEQHELLCATLAKLVDVLDCDELSLLAHCCGIQISEFYGNASNEEFSFDLNIEQCNDNEIN